jgi:hypothetical protein
MLEPAWAKTYVTMCVHHDDCYDNDDDDDGEDDVAMMCFHKFVFLH